MRQSLLWSSALVVLGLAGCGGGGGGGGSPVAPLALPTRQAPSLALTASDAAHVAARAVAAASLMHWIGTSLAADIAEVSPSKPRAGGPCGAGSWSLQYNDADRDNGISPGDTVELAAPDCGVPAYAHGTALATVLAAENGALVDVQVDIASGKPPALAGWNWVPAVSGRIRLTAHESGFWLRVDRDFRLQIDAEEWLSVGRAGIRLVPEPGVLSRPGLEGGFDLTLHDAVLGEGRLQFDTAGGVATFGAANVAPAPGYYVLRGAGSTRMTIGDAGPPQPSWFRVRTDSTGSGAYDGDEIISFLEIFAPL